MPGMWYVLAAVAVVACATAQQNFTLEEIVNAHFAQRGFTGQWISDTQFSYTIPNEPGIFAYDCSTDTSEVFVTGSLMDQLNTTNPVVSPDQNYILASQDVQQVYRYSRTARYALFNVQTGQTIQVADDKRLQLCIFGGTQHALAYVYGNNLYYQHNSNAQPIAITNDGVEGVVYNGHTDWVYEEDVMYTGQATWFSTNASYLAFATFNDTEVESYSYYYYTDSDHEPYLYPKLVDLKYPKVGQRNPPVVLRVVNLSQLVANPTNPNFIRMEAPADVTEGHILGGVTWLTDNEIAMHWTNRRQNYSVLQICNVVTGVCEEERREEPRGWIPLALPRFSKDGRYYVSLRWSMRQADNMAWQHLYVSKRVNGEIISTSVSPGAFSVINFIGMVEQTEESPDTLGFYYTRTMANMPWQSEVCVSGVTDKCFSRDLVLPDGGPCTRTSATLSPGGSFMTITCESPEEPSATYIISLKNETKAPVIWEANNIVRQRLVGKARWGSIITTVPLQDGFPAPVRLLLPPGLDVNDTNTKYPVIFYVYSGPNTNTVFNTFTVGYHSYLTTSRNVIYMLADGRGSGLKGQDILFALNNALGTVEVEDHFVILRQVLDRYPFMDRTRVGIWGHSYGGYATLLTMLKDDEKLFQCGVSGAPVTSWLYYNTMYTERYMGLPTEDDNLKGYQAGDVTLLAEKLRGHDFFIMHGNADDNVHYQNAVKLMKALQNLDIPFEQMSYPDEAHSLSGVNLHRYHAMDRYWTRCLRL